MKVRGRVNGIRKREDACLKVREELISRQRELKGLKGTAVSEIAMVGEDWSCEKI